jgi:uncharacterized protein with gpF-like domain
VAGRRRPRVVRAVRPNLGVEAAYRRRLTRLVEEMHASVSHWVEAAYRREEPEIVADASPAADLRDAIRRLSRRWLRRFDDLAPKMAEHFSRAVGDRSDRSLKKALRDGGMSVDFKMTPAVRGVLLATTTANVSLIKSIPRQYLGRVEGLVMRSIQTGRDLGSLSRELQSQLGVTKRRAALIARDQNNKATASVVRTRQIEAGITKAVWLHSGGGKTRRPTHVANSGKEYDVRRGWFDPDEGRVIHPGELISCRCVSRAVVPGFD